MNVENELDIRGLFRALWAGKIWIAGMAVLFALIVLGDDRVVEQTVISQAKYGATA